jgi:hypothetical protein
MIQIRRKEKDFFELIEGNVSYVFSLYELYFHFRRFRKSQLIFLQTLFDCCCRYIIRNLIK